MEETLNPDKIFSEISLAYRYKEPREKIMSLYASFPDKDVVKSYDEITPIHLAAEYADPDAMEYLLSQGAKAGAKGKYNKTALYSLAAGNSDSRDWKEKAENVRKCAAMLLAARVSALIRDDGAGGNLCYHAAVKAGNFAFVYAMIEGKVKLDMPDKDGASLLHLIATYPGKSAMHSIKFRPQSEHPQFEEVLEECFDLARTLIDYGLDPQARDQSRKTAGEYAVEYGLRKLAVLFSGEYDDSDPALADKIASGGKTLHEAAQTGDLPAVEALIRLGADVNEVYTEDKYNKLYAQTPLAVACYSLYPDCVKALLSAGADPNYRDGEYSRTPFYWFVKDINRYGSEQEKNKSLENILKQLFDAGMEPDGFVDETDDTPLNLTFRHNFGKSGVTEVFRRELLDSGLCDFNIPDRSGVTPLMNLAKEDWNLSENDLVTLLEFGADMAARDDKGNTALIYAAMNRKHPIARTFADLLFSFGDPVPAAVNNEGKSAMDYAVEQNNEDLVKFLLEKM